MTSSFGSGVRDRMQSSTIDARFTKVLPISQNDYAFIIIDDLSYNVWSLLLLSTTINSFKGFTATKLDGLFAPSVI